MFLTAPENCSEASVGGEKFIMDENGQIEVPDDGYFAAALAPHGFVQPTPPDDTIDGALAPSGGAKKQRKKPGRK